MSEETPSVEPEIKLGDLMDKDPLLLKDEEVDMIVAYLRAQYANWVIEEQRALMDERKAKTSKGTSVKAKEVNLSDLGL